MGKDPNPKEIERTKALYCGEVTFVDRWVGHLVEKIDDLGLREDTLILVLSDHGTQVWDHGGFGKGGGNMRAYNTGIVWQMRFPDGRPKQIDALVQSHDVMPTILDILDVPFARAEGRSVMPLVRGEVGTHRDPIVTGWADASDGNARAYASVRTAKWNYVTPVHAEEGREALFDLESDPGEDTNVIGDHPQAARELRTQVEAVVGRRLPTRLNEVCDPEPSPIMRYLQARG